jgi:hypothetical protein
MTDSCETVIEDASKPPETDTDVAARNQGAASDNSQLVTVIDRNQEGLSESSLDIELGRLAGTDARRHGIQVVLQLAAAWAKETNTKFGILGDKNTKLTDELTRAQVKIASLEAANTERAKHLPLVNAALLLGPIIFAFGLDQCISGNWGVGIVAALIGGCISVAALYAQRKDRQ